MVVFDLISILATSGSTNTLDPLAHATVAVQVPNIMIDNTTNKMISDPAINAVVFKIEITETPQLAGVALFIKRISLHCTLGKCYTACEG